MKNPQPTSYSGSKDWTLSLRSETKEGCPLLFTIVLEVLTKVNRQETGIKGIQIGKKIKLY